MCGQGGFLSQWCDIDLQYTTDEAEDDADVVAPTPMVRKTKSKVTTHTLTQAQPARNFVPTAPAAPHDLHFRGFVIEGVGTYNYQFIEA